MSREPPTFKPYRRDAQSRLAVEREGKWKTSVKMRNYYTHFDPKVRSNCLLGERFLIMPLFSSCASEALRVVFSMENVQERIRSTPSKVVWSNLKPNNFVRFTLPWLTSADGRAVERLSGIRSVVYIRLYRLAGRLILIPWFVAEPRTESYRGSTSPKSACGKVQL